MGTGRSKLPRGIRDITKNIDTEHFKVWSRKAQDTHSYGYDLSLQEYASKNTNVDELINKMSTTDLDAFDSWASGSFMGMATRDVGQLSAYKKTQLRTYDKYIDQSIFYEGVVVKSLAGNSLLTGSRANISDSDYRNNIEGSIIRFNMPRSAAAAAEGLTIGSMGKNVEYSFHIPAYTGGVGMFLISPKVNPGWTEEQREVMLGRDTFWRVGARTWNEQRKIWEVPMYYVGKDRHKYL